MNESIATTLVDRSLARSLEYLGKFVFGYVDYSQPTKFLGCLAESSLLAVLSIILNNPIPRLKWRGLEGSIDQVWARSICFCQ